LLPPLFKKIATLASCLSVGGNQNLPSISAGKSKQKQTLSRLERQNPKQTSALQIEGAEIYILQSYSWLADKPHSNANRDTMFLHRGGGSKGLPILAQAVLQTAAGGCSKLA
jgi:hypothetical protein